MGRSPTVRKEGNSEVPLRRRVPQNDLKVPSSLFTLKMKTDFCFGVIGAMVRAILARRRILPGTGGILLAHHRQAAARGSRMTERA